ncbi:MAG: hypothetical protein NT022_00320, partial [Deltaproteobacteria bacterium]|nr:hypothetical protein [Deltaproteobacteria bacterium]
TNPKTTGIDRAPLFIGSSSYHQQTYFHDCKHPAKKNKKGRDKTGGIRVFIAKTVLPPSGSLMVLPPEY